MPSHVESPAAHHAPLTIFQGAALYIGAVLGTGVIALPALAAEVAGLATRVGGVGRAVRAARGHLRRTRRALSRRRWRIDLCAARIRAESRGDRRMVLLLRGTGRRTGRRHVRRRLRRGRHGRRAHHGHRHRCGADRDRVGRECIRRHGFGPHAARVVGTARHAAARRGARLRAACTHREPASVRAARLARGRPGCRAARVEFRRLGSDHASRGRIPPARARHAALGGNRGRGGRFSVSVGCCRERDGARAVRGRIGCAARRTDRGRHRRPCAGAGRRSRTVAHARYDERVLRGRGQARRGARARRRIARVARARQPGRRRPAPQPRCDRRARRGRTRCDDAVGRRAEAARARHVRVLRDGVRPARPPR